MADNITKKRMLRDIKEVEFALKDLNLYLNTHPDCSEALEMYKLYEKKSRQLICEFERMFGPLTPSAVNNTDAWLWIKGPWPWENC